MLTNCGQALLKYIGSREESEVAGYERVNECLVRLEPPARVINRRKATVEIRKKTLTSDSSIDPKYPLFVILTITACLWSYVDTIQPQ